MNSRRRVTELERILRQLREEEVERSLVALEARFAACSKCS